MTSVTPERDDDHHRTATSPATGVLTRARRASVMRSPCTSWCDHSIFGAVWWPSA